MAANPFFLDSDLQAEPFFRPGRAKKEITSWSKQPDNSWQKTTDRLGALYAPATGSAVAARQRDALLARMIPALSLPAGSRPVTKFDRPAEQRNIDMNSPAIRGSGEPWPTNRNGDKRWWHSDLRQVAYPYVSGLYGKIVEFGNLQVQMNPSGW